MEALAGRKAAMLERMKSLTFLKKERARVYGILHVVNAKHEEISLRLAAARELFRLNDPDYATIEDIVKNKTGQPYRHRDSSLETSKDDDGEEADDAAVYDNDDD